MGVMAFLVLHIGDSASYLVKTHAEDTIAFLPSKGFLAG